MANNYPEMTSNPFRAIKRRKIFRSRPRENEDQDDNTSGASPRIIDSAAQNLQTSGTPEKDDTNSSVAEILRRRKAGKQRKGIEFSNSASASAQSDAPTSTALVPVDQGPDVQDVVTGRFAAQTGQVTDVMDKHMMSYIDSKMASLRSSNPQASQTQRDQATSSADLLRTRQPAGMGKLLEIDLGPDTTAQNIARTEAAQKRLENGEIEVPGGRPARPTPKLGRDGKPWRPRKRRNSEDMKRDKIVEDLMKEAPLDIYETPPSPSQNTDLHSDQAADDRIAEQFRRDFLDQVASKNVKKQPAPPGVGGKAEGPKGPKLGGSRSARAAMRALEEKAAAKKR